MGFIGNFTVLPVVKEFEQEAVLYRTVDSGSAVGLLEKNVSNRQCLFCGIYMWDHSILTAAIHTARINSPNPNPITLTPSQTTN